MNYLQLVQRAVLKAGAKVAVPTTVVGQTGINQLFVDWVADAWKEIQVERLGYYPRVSRDLSMSLVAGTYEYSLPITLEGVDTRSLTVDLAGEAQTPVFFCTYDHYRTRLDRQVRADGKPQYFTLTPSNTLVFWPNPDAAYTLRYDGILIAQIFDSTDAAGVGSSDILEPTGLREEYQDAVVWQAIMNYAMHFEDGSKLAEAQAKMRPYIKYFEERFMPTVTLQHGILYGSTLYNA